MRILKISFENLNSLVGKWEIDLTHGTFGADGIFAITGPTGAGKSTLLDAMCLALYASTPRLGKITKAANEIMSRKTGSCFAEVVFETQTAKYRCTWRQRKAGNKHNGELQIPKHEIVNADTNVILASSLKTVGVEIQSVTGMDFNQFTRSILLAQGSFASFLQASPDDRSPILEQITGTEIYSKISIKVHERKSVEKNTLEELKNGIEGLNYLNPEQESTLLNQCETLSELYSSLNTRIEQYQQRVTNISQINFLKNELDNLLSRKKFLEEKRLNFNSLQFKLNKAQNALEILASYSLLTEVRNQKNEDLRRLNEDSEKLIYLSAEKIRLAEMKSKKSLIFEEAKVQQIKVSEIFRAVHELDILIAEKRKSLQSAELNYLKNSKILDLEKLNGKVQLEDLAIRKKVYLQILKDSENQKNREVIVTKFSWFEEIFKTSKNLSITEGSKKLQIESLEKTMLTQKILSEKKKAEYLLQESKVSELQKKLSEKNQLLKNILQNFSLHQWQQKLDFILSEKLLYLEAKKVCSLMLDNQKFLTESVKSRELYTQRQEFVSSENKLIFEKYSTDLKNFHHLETEFFLLKKIESLEENRAHLKSGDTCPLCGSTHHPFLENAELDLKIPKISDIESKLNDSKMGLKSGDQKIQDLKIESVQLSANVKNLDANILEATNRSINLSSELQNIRENVDFDFFNEKWEVHELVKTIDLKLEETEKENKIITDIMNDGRGLELEIALARELFETEVTALNLVALENVSLEQSFIFAEEGLRASRVEHADIVKSQKKDFEFILASLMEAGFKFEENLDITLQNLKNFRDDFVKNVELAKIIESEINSLTLSCELQNLKIEGLEGDLLKCIELFDVLKQDYAALQLQRFNLFGEQNVSVEEKKIEASLESTQKDFLLFSELFTKADVEFQQLELKIKELNSFLVLKAENLKALEVEFLQLLAHHGFDSESDFSRALLPEHERIGLVGVFKQLADEQMQLSTLENQTQKALNLELSKVWPAEEEFTSIEEWQQNIVAMQSSQKDVQQQIGALKQQLAESNSLKILLGEKMNSLKNQELEFSKWSLLHDLIGSSDGKKFRNFAQGLTFEKMVFHANKQLRKMSGRYLLVRCSKQPLELNVVDNYQGGEVRSTKNLSGGECFVVSLALALGLSQMASKNVRVDSLFLDEGFGTLDEEALNTALETLAGLQQEGKLIGVISHVGALKERISAQIQVVPQSGGKSILVGPGCRML